MRAPRLVFPLIGLVLALSASTALGKPAKKPKLDVAALIEALKTKDEDKLKETLTAIEKAGKEAREAAKSVEGLLAKGLPIEVARAAIRALGAMGETSSTKALLTWASHRNIELRTQAVLAIGKTGGPGALVPLKKALSDKAPRVRGAGASALGELGDRAAQPELLKALDDKVFEAASAVGLLCDDSECDELTKRLGKVPFDVAAGGIEQVLFRKAVSEAAKERMIEKVRDVGTGEAHRFLKDVLSKWNGSDKLKTALEAAVSATKTSPDDKPKD